MTWIVSDNPKPKRPNTKRKRPTSEASAGAQKQGKSQVQSSDDIDLDHTTATVTTLAEASLDDGADKEGDESAAKALSKTQRKRARHQKDKSSLTEDEKSWAEISLHALPPMPTSDTPTVLPSKSQKMANKKNQKKPQQQQAKNNEGEIIPANFEKIDDWGWSTVSTDGMSIDDMEGFLCLEEIDGVDVEYLGTEETGRTVMFKQNTKTKKKGTKVNHDAPLEVPEGEVYYDIDTFDEGVLLKQKQDEQKAGEKSLANNTDAMEIDVPETVEEEVPSTPKKAQKKEKQSASKKDAVSEDKEEAQTEADSASEDTEEQEEDGVNPKDEKKLTKKERNKKKQEERRAAMKAEKASRRAEEDANKKPFDPLEGVDMSFDVSAWESYNLSDKIINGIKKQQFKKPSPIQSNTLPLGLAGRDIVGVAETGSGKTLAFGLPIIQHLAESTEPEGLTALILTPTRELAIQVKDHLAKFTQFTGHHVVPIVGGMSIQKQTRQLDRNPSIVVATPGRLWELISTNPTYSERVKQARFLVLDEADRMLEQGHFEELASILKLMSRKREVTSDWNADDASTAKEDDTTTMMSEFKNPRQTFIFTATLSKELSTNLKRKKSRAQEYDTSDAGTQGTMEELMDRIDFQDENPAFVRIDSGKAVASKLLEGRIECLTTDKDLYLYYFVKKYPGRTLVFVNSIDALRHLVPVMRLLGVDALGLHAQMQQRQRLKNLDRFKQNPEAVMVASDVAARGLDIPLVDHVIHYQVPRSGDIYVHRSGRTARANNEGISLLICGPDESFLYRKMCITLKKDNGIPEFPIDHGVVSEMKKRLTLAKKIDDLEHRMAKSSHEDDWMLKMAEEMDVILDEDLLNDPKKKDRKTKQHQQHDNDDEALGASVSAGNERDRGKAKALRAELKAMLQKPLMPRGASAKYITGGAIRDLADRLRNQGNNPLLPAHLNTTALEDIKAHQSQKNKKNKKEKANL
ncbi:ATP-dependent RNA helicase [Actinomortierella ambigua]|uniref:ATP-dependent RNA helicase n=1 Tax=Actinomortierella ambigua TaxID=1343610 RepID=A0A9P6U0G3_9FUNG|nr:ATP-dependent RNA helicase [Actinomortierella ambigua]